MSNIPVVNLGSKYVNGFNLSWFSNTQLTMTDGLCRDSTDTWDIVVNTTAHAGTVIDATIRGLNGLDSGALAASTFYAIFAIADSTYNHPSGFLISATTHEAPVMPFGYDVARRIGWALTDGSSHFVKMYQEGNASDRTYYYETPISILSGGSSATYTTVTLAAAIPVMSNLYSGVKFQALYTPAVAGNSASIRPTGSSSTTFTTISGVVAAVAQKTQITVPATLVGSSAYEIDYIVTASDTLTLLVSSFEDHL
jgi:hypothetical protein